MEETVKQYLSDLSIKEVIELADIDTEDVIEQYIDSDVAINYLLEQNNSNNIFRRLENFQPPDDMVLDYVTNSNIPTLADDLATSDPIAATLLLNSLLYWRTKGRI